MTMTEEEKEATENLNKLVQQRKDKTNTITIKYDSCICSTKELNIALNLIQRQQEDIQRMQELLDKSDANNYELKKEIKKKDKIINEMIEYIDFDKLNFQCSPLCVKENCQEECIKQYFERKVKDENIRI